MKVRKSEEPKNPPVLVSQYYNLNGELEFHDIDLENDNKWFLCPYIIENLRNKNVWANKMTIQAINYFNYVLELLKSKRYKQADKTFTNLNEWNLTRLGMSAKGFEGKGINLKSRYLLQCLNDDGFILMEYVERIQDLKLFVDGIKDDKVSDAFTNIVKSILIEFTQEQCLLHKIPMKPVKVKNIWDDNSKSWVTQMVELPHYKNKPFALVPKECLTTRSWYNATSFARKMVLEDQQSQFIDDKDKPSKKELIEKIKNKKWLLNKDYIKHYLAKNKKKSLVNVFRQIKK